jgi:hypothetical protein
MTTHQQTSPVGGRLAPQARDAINEERAAVRRSLRARRLRGALIASAFGFAMAGVYLDSLALLVLGMIASIPSVVSFALAVKPHDHWAEFRRRGPDDP